MTKTPMTLEDLMPIKANKAVKPKPAAATSVPGMLATFHNEWDALMLETNEAGSDYGSTHQPPPPTHTHNTHSSSRRLPNSTLSSILSPTDV